MPQWEVDFRTTKYVDADTEEEAIDKAIEEINPGDYTVLEMEEDDEDSDDEDDDQEESEQ